MANADTYQVDTARDDFVNLREVLQNVATRTGHRRIVSVTWQPEREGASGDRLTAGYTIISEKE